MQSSQSHVKVSNVCPRLSLLVPKELYLPLQCWLVVWVHMTSVCFQHLTVWLLSRGTYKQAASCDLKISRSGESTTSLVGKTRFSQTQMIRPNMGVTRWNLMADDIQPVRVDSLLGTSGLKTLWTGLHHLCAMPPRSMPFPLAPILRVLYARHEAMYLL